MRRARSTGPAAREQRRLLLLQILQQSASYSSEAAALRAALRGCGLAASQAAVCADLLWLREQDLVTLVADQAALTLRGEDVAVGAARVPGVAAP